MTAKIAVAVIHGIANDDIKRPAMSTERTFSERLYRSLRRRLGRRVMAEDIAWREIFWADILAGRQNAYLKRIHPRTRYPSIRRFLVRGIADAAAFNPVPGKADTAYEEILGRVSKTITALNKDTADHTPLILLAHSFGSHIISSYIWDMQMGRVECANSFERLETLAQFATIGSNLPLFTFGIEPEAIHPIKFPGRGLDPQKRAAPWWVNYYDRDDVLGFPLSPISPSYQAMADRGELLDVPVNVGGIFTSWNPASHSAYWTDRDFVDPFAGTLQGILDQLK